MFTTGIQAQRGRGRQKAKSSSWSLSRAKQRPFSYSLHNDFYDFFSLSQVINPQTELSCASGFFSRKQGFGDQRRHQDRIWHDQSHSRCGYWSYRGLRNSVEPSPEKCLPRGEGGGVVIPWSYLPLVEGCSWALSPPALQPALHVGWGCPCSHSEGSSQVCSEKLPEEMMSEECTWVGHSKEV